MREGNIVEANPAFLDLIRVVTLDRVEDKGLDNWLGGSSVDLQVLMANLREHSTVRRFSSVIRDELGGVENVEVSATKITSRDGPLFGFAIRETSRSEVRRRPPRATRRHPPSSPISSAASRSRISCATRPTSSRSCASRRRCG